MRHLHGSFQMEEKTQRVGMEHLKHKQELEEQRYSTVCTCLHSTVDYNGWFMIGLLKKPMQLKFKKRNWWPHGDTHQRWSHSYNDWFRIQWGMYVSLRRFIQEKKWLGIGNYYRVATISLDCKTYKYTNMCLLYRIISTDHFFFIDVVCIKIIINHLDNNPHNKIT